MPDVTRSDSQRSDSSLRPRVSFNRDVHVKRIVPRDGTRTALSGDGNGHLVPTAVRKEKLNKSKKELAEEAANILQKAGSLHCISNSGGLPLEKFYTVPRNRSKHHKTTISTPSSTVERKVKRTHSFNNNDDDKTTPFNYDSLKRKQHSKHKSSRGIRDATNLKRSSPSLKDARICNDGKENLNTSANTKKQLSPIIEVNPREDYFTETNEKDELDNNRKKAKKEESKIYLIDIDKAEKVNSKSKSKPKTKAIEELTDSSKMFRNRELPGRSRTIDTMVRRLTNDSSRPPPIPNPMVVPNSSMQHNNNQPFSYTRGLSPEKYEPGNPIIYAQVVGLGPTKQTIHTAYNRKQFNSDSDEGLGNEESFKKTYSRFSEESKKEESPILPKYRHFRSSYDELNEKVLVGSTERGRADGMDAKRSESLSEQPENDDGFEVPRHDLSTRRDLLESRINRRITEGENRYQYYSSSPSPVVSKTFIKDTRVNPGIKKSTMYKSTPDIYHMDSRPRTEYEYSYFSLQRNSKNRNGGYYANVDESEDEGFASSLLIGNERQQNAADNKSRMNENAIQDDYQQQQRYMQNYSGKNGNNVNRERSVDDGSHYDPRIDKNFEKERAVLVKDDKKPPKPHKKNRLEKVKQLFIRDNRKKKSKEPQMVSEQDLRARYREYKGDESVRSNDYQKTESSYQTNNGNTRRRLSTPSPSPSPIRKIDKVEKTHHSWFKSLDRLATNKQKKESPKPPKDAPTPSKSLRFFGDSDSDCPKPSTLKTKSQSTSKLHQIAREPRKNGHVSESSLNISQKPPAANGANPRYAHVEVKNPKRRLRRADQVSSLESSTEGESSQQSQRSVVYLHAATVGDIPDPIRMKYKRSSASREELSSNVSSRMQPSVKHLSRSFSVLAPWRPNQRHGNGSSDSEKNRTNGSTKDLSKGTSTSTLYKKKERMPREHSRYSRAQEEPSAGKKISQKSQSVESLRHEKGKSHGKNVHRSLSMPKDENKSAGWFRLYKGKHKSDYLA